MLLGIKDISTTHKCGLIHRNINLPFSLSQFPLCLLVCTGGRMGECTFWCRIKGPGHKMKYLHAQSMHKMCTKCAQSMHKVVYRLYRPQSVQIMQVCTCLRLALGCIIFKLWECANLCACTICPNSKVCKSAKYANSVQCAKCMCATYGSAETHLPVWCAYGTNCTAYQPSVQSMHKVCKCRTDVHAQVGHRAR